MNPGSGPGYVLPMSWLVALLTACKPAPDLPVDADGDGFFSDVDCDDADADAFPGAVEFCDGTDNDCNGLIDDGPPWDARAWYPDVDGDGWGCADCAPVTACDAPSGHVRATGDCDDGNPSVHPAAVEVCNGVDDDCDGSIDVDPDRRWFRDADADGYGDPDAARAACDPEPGEVADGTDCDDERDDVNPGAVEICNGIDDDCDELIDDEDAVPAPTVWFPDGDEDGFGSDAFSLAICAPPPGAWVVVAGDCDDEAPAVYPGAPEVCDGVDRDCDGEIDGPDAPFALGARAPLTIAAGEAVRSALITARVDLGPLGGGQGARVVLGDCASGYVELPTRFVDGWDAFGVPGIDGDDDGLLLAVYDTDGDGSTAETLAGGTHAGWLHLGLPGDGPGDASASATSLDGDRSALALDGVLARPLSGEMSPEFDQSGWMPRVETPAGALLPVGIPALASSHPALSRVAGTGVVGLGSGAVRFRIAWWRVAGRPEVWGRVRIDAETDIELAHAVDWRRAIVGFAGDAAGPLSFDGSAWSRAGFALQVIDAPVGSAVEPVDRFELRGSDAPGPTDASYLVPAGTALSSVMVVLVPADDASARLAELAAPVQLELSPQSP